MENNKQITFSINRNNDENPLILTLVGQNQNIGIHTLVIESSIDYAFSIEVATSVTF